MAYRIELKPSAVRELKKLPKADQRRVVRRIEALTDDPYPKDSKKLESGKGQTELRRVRADDYRVVYQVRRTVLLVVVVRIRHRKDVYRGL